MKLINSQLLGMHTRIRIYQRQTFRNATHAWRIEITGAQKKNIYKSIFTAREGSNRGSNKEGMVRSQMKEKKEACLF